MLMLCGAVHRLQEETFDVAAAHQVRQLRATAAFAGKL